LTQRDLARSLAKKFALSQRASPRLLHFITDQITAALARDERITLHNFGVFRRVRRAAKTLRHPKTGQPLTLPAHFTAAFRPAPALKTRLK
jgi:nucleoid DNA-binding protein